MTIIVDCCLAFIFKYANFPIHRMDLNLVDSFIKLVDSQIRIYGRDASKLPKDFDDILCNIFLFSAVWSFGGAIDEISRKKLN